MPEPTAHSHLVNLGTFIPEVKLDIRYATDDNLIGVAVYQKPQAFLVQAAAHALLDASKDFKEKGLGILLWDAYRPQSISKLFWELTPERLHSFEGDPIEGSVHNRGCAVDLTLYDLKTGRLLSMPSEFDDFTDKAKMSYLPKDPKVLANRDQLQKVMEAHRFTVRPDEWWHYNFNGYEKYPVMDISFEDLPIPTNR